MDNTITALQNLYVALGGELTDTYETIASGTAVSNYVIIPDMLNALAIKAATVVTAANTSELPAVTAANNGSVLKVANGKWAIGTDETTTG